MSSRKPTRESYDLEIDLGGDPNGEGCFAYALIKLAYKINTEKGRLENMPAVALENDFRNKDLVPRLPAHSDFWPAKQSTDVAVLGSAYAVGQPVRKMITGVEVGSRNKQVLVIGDRNVEWRKDRQAKIGEAQLFTRMPMSIERAYGGCDFRVPFKKDDPRSMGVTLECDYPGLYPRNPWGTGYLVMPEPIDGMPLPNLEDPNDVLTAERILLGDPANWFQQPLPCYLEWTPVNCFPRNIFFAIECEPWFPAPDDASLKEVKQGHLPTGYREHLKDQHYGTAPHLRFRQESSPGLMFSKDLHGAGIRITGMHPQHAGLEFQLPKAAPYIEMKIEKKREELQPHLASLAIYPDQEYLTMTYTVSMPSPRPFLPGIHKYIPIAVSVNGDRAVPYRPPDTLKDRLAAAESAQKKK